MLITPACTKKHYFRYCQLFQPPGPLMLNFKIINNLGPPNCNFFISDMPKTDWSICACHKTVDRCSDSIIYLYNDTCLYLNSSGMCYGYNHRSIGYGWSPLTNQAVNWPSEGSCHPTIPLPHVTEKASIFQEGVYCPFKDDINATGQPYHKQQSNHTICWHFLISSVH